MKKNASDTNPAYQWYYKDYLTDSRLDGMTAAGLALYQEIWNRSLTQPTRGLFANLEGRALSIPAILDRCRLTDAEKKKGWRELVRRKLIARLDGDGPWHIEQIYKDGRLSEIRRAAGKRGAAATNAAKAAAKAPAKGAAKQSAKSPAKVGSPIPTPTPSPGRNKQQSQFVRTVADDGDPGGGGVAENSLSKSSGLGLGKIQAAKLRFTDQLAKRFVLRGYEPRTFARIADHIAGLVGSGREDLGIFDAAIGWADQAIASGVDNPKGFFVKLCKKHTGFEGLGLVYRRAVQG